LRGAIAKLNEMFENDGSCAVVMESTATAFFFSRRASRLTEGRKMSFASGCRKLGSLATRLWRFPFETVDTLESRA